MKNKNIENIISTHKFALYIIILLQAVSLLIIFLVLDNFFDSQTLTKDINIQELIVIFLIIERFYIQNLSRVL